MLERCCCESSKEMTRIFVDIWSCSEVCTPKKYNEGPIRSVNLFKVLHHPGREKRGTAAQLYFALCSSTLFEWRARALCKEDRTEEEKRVRVEKVQRLLRKRLVPMQIVVKYISQSS